MKSSSIKALSYLKGKSKLQEHFGEYRFLSDLIWVAASKKMSINTVRGDFDAFGYDIMLEHKGQVKRIQLKTKAGKNNRWDIHKSLLKFENGFVILIVLSDSEPLVSYEILKKRTKNRKPINAPKTQKTIPKRKVIKGDFEPKTIAEILTILFPINK